MTGTVPAVSVVIPYFNAGRFIDATLGRLAEQTFRDFEVVIVDDGSSPEEARLAEEAAARWRATCVRQDNAGPGSARNRGAGLARGEWIAFLDADDRWDETKLARQMAVAADFDMVLCDTRTMTLDGALLGHHRWSAYDRQVFANAVLRGDVFSFTSSILIRTDAFRALGGFDPRLRFLEDHHLLYRAVRTLRWTCLDEALSFRMVHEDSMSHLSRNLDFSAHVARRKLFLDVMSEFESGLDKAPHLLRELHSNIKRCIALRRRGDALGMALQAIRLDPVCLKTYGLCGAIALSILLPGLFEQWNPALANRARNNGTGRTRPCP